MGSGKTHLAEAAGRNAMKHGNTVRFEEVPAFLEGQRPGQYDDDKAGLAYYHVMNADYLILDDLGMEKDSEWTQDLLGSIINQRYQDGRRLLITTNLLHRETMIGKLGERVTDRLFDTKSGIVKQAKLGAGSYRK